MRILVTSASGANGNGYGAILGFGPEGEFTGPFSSDPRIADPRGMSLHPSGALVYLNSSGDRVLALDLHGNVVRDSGRIAGLDPGGAEFGPDGRYYVTMRRQRTIRAMPAALDEEGEFLLPEGIVPFPRGFGFGHDGQLYLASGGVLDRVRGLGLDLVSVERNWGRTSSAMRRARDEPDSAGCRAVTVSTSFAPAPAWGRVRHTSQPLPALPPRSDAHRVLLPGRRGCPRAGS